MIGVAYNDFMIGAQNAIGIFNETHETAFYRLI